MIARACALLLTAVLLAGCAAYVLVPPGRTTVGEGLSVEAPSAWSRVAGEDWPIVWTHDGIFLDALWFMPGIRDGQTLIRASALSSDAEEGTKKGTVPVFRKDMSATEIMELFDATMVRALNTSLASASNLQPVTFARLPGFRFEYRFTRQDRVERMGVATGAVRDGRLYLIFHFGSAIYHLERDRAEGEAIVASARFI
ncbi:MAG: hypothetical protein FJX53_10465 [Alphaproteobacteria bacterium]|nr:hypothetical protein [Alphaproteobacteria bacterium]